MPWSCFRITGIVCGHDPKQTTSFPPARRLIKRALSRRCQPKDTQRPSASRLRKGEPAVWHRRLWEQVIRDAKDGKQSVESLHVNPVNHGLAGAPKAWEFSSVPRDVREGVYAIRWDKTEGINFVEGLGNA